MKCILHPVRFDPACSVCETQDGRRHLEPEQAKYVHALGQKTPVPASPNAGTLEWFPAPEGHGRLRVTFEADEFTSLCPKTGQPDFGMFVIDYIPMHRCLESKSLKLYLGSFRNTAAFWETLVSRIFDDLLAMLEPLYLQVSGRQNVRGGIALVATREGGMDEETH